MIKIHLKKGRDKPVRNGHPWIFSRAIECIDGKPEPGEICSVVTSNNEKLGEGYCNPLSAINVRMLTSGSLSFTADELALRIDRAAGQRLGHSKIMKSSAYRLINAEGDFLPGLIVDKYDSGLCIQVQTAGMERLRTDIFSYLEKTLAPAFMYERSDSDQREREGLPRRKGLISGSMPETITFKENGRLFAIDLVTGQKTGFFLDQRENRLLVRDYAKDAAVCDCFSYSGGFSVNALAGGARLAHLVDSSKTALETARCNLELNGFPVDENNFFQEDVFSYLRQTDMIYDSIILDPPKFAKHPGEVPRAARGYKDINLLAMKKIAKNGIIFTFSCSNAIDPRLFRQIVFSAAVDSGRSVQLLHILGAGCDHPVNISHPEGEYLKGLVLRVL
jgi:23S rRNA (cytosine1962-C5)-methyltransferase